MKGEESARLSTYMFLTTLQSVLPSCFHHFEGNLPTLVGLLTGSSSGSKLRKLSGKFHCWRAGPGIP